MLLNILPYQADLAPGEKIEKMDRQTTCHVGDESRLPTWMPILKNSSYFWDSLKKLKEWGKSWKFTQNIFFIL